LDGSRSSTIAVTTLLLIIAVLVGGAPAARAQSQPGSAPASAYIEDGLYKCAKQTLPGLERSVTDHKSAFDPDSGRNFFYDGQAWIDSKTGEHICPKVVSSSTMPPPPHVGPDAPAALDLRYSHVPGEFCSEKDRDKFIKRELQPVLDRAKAQVAAWTDYVASLTALQTQSGDAQYHAALADQIAQANATLAQANQFLAAVQELLDDASHARIKDCPPTFSLGVGIGIGGGHDDDHGHEDNHGHNSGGSDNPQSDTPQPKY
jgi:hypothetical protein